MVGPISADILEWWQDSPVIRSVKRTTKYRSAAEFADKPAELSPRQAIFYRNLIRLAEHFQSGMIPINFDIAGRGTYTLDQGCIKIAEHAGFIRPLENGPNGRVETIALAWRYSPSD